MRYLKSTRMVPRDAVRGLLLAALSFVAMPVWAASGDLTEEQIVGNLHGLSANAPAIDAAVLAQEALAQIGKPRGTPMPPAWAALSSLPQLTVEINFEYNSVAIVPESYRALGLMADALHHPVLLGDKFLIVGHTDAKGDAKYNLTLSQKRAEAIREILTTTFAVAPNRLYTVGVGEEMPIDAAHPEAAINRRVQVINIGQVK
jgi:outer membrane protein OmpA-like peptidoglycan-associated protein